MNYSGVLRLGAKDGVTGSCHQLLMGARQSLLIDCGLFQGAATSVEGKSTAERLAIEFPLDTIKFLVASHIHVDHVGRIPYLLAVGLKGPILCSEPSAFSSATRPKAPHFALSRPTARAAATQILTSSAITFGLKSIPYAAIRSMRTRRGW